MKNQTNIQIVRAENGFSINVMTDEAGKNKKYVATTEQETTDRLKAVADSLFTPAAPLTPAKPQG